MTEAVVWIVLWVLFAFAGAWLIYVIVALGSVGLAAATETIWIAPVGIAIGWVLTVAWFVFAAIQTVLQIIAVVQLAAGG